MIALTYTDPFTSALRAAIFVGAAVGLLICAVILARAWWSIRRRPRPFDWAEECPELRGDGDHPHVHVLEGVRPRARNFTRWG